MPLETYAVDGTEPTVDDDAWVSVESVLVGDVTVAPEAIVWPGAVLRGDVGQVAVGRRARVGDNATVHASRLGDEALCGHGAVLNEAAVGDGSLIGFNATVHAGATVGERSIVAAATVVPGDYEVPPESFVRGIPAEVSPLAEAAVDPEEVIGPYVTGPYADLASRHDDLFS